MRITFFVVDNLPAVSDHPGTTVVLVRDNWNDYGYVTTFRLHLYLSASQAPVDVGSVKILHRDQTGGMTPLDVRFTQLTPGYCSLGQSLSYYENLHQAGTDVRDAVLAGLRDIAADPTIADSFSEHPGFRKSLERTGSATRAIHDAAALLANTADAQQPGAPMTLPFRTTVGGSHFTVPLAFNQAPLLPGRINVIIGYNGTGKTKLLANLASVASRAPANRYELMDSAGAFVREPAFPFGAVVSVSYSAFDTFAIPGRESRQAADQMRTKGEVFGYVYCGLRSFRGRGVTDPLKSIAELRAETVMALQQTRASRTVLLREALEPLLREPSYPQAGFTTAALADDRRFEVVFDRLSTGHKIVLNIVLQLVAHMQIKSLLLFDEPECHLHPPLLAALLRSINVVLDDRDSYAVIATHSPVVLQEVPARYVHILERIGEMTRIRRPEQETFAENVGYLTKTVFSLDSRSTDYHSTLENLAEHHTPDQIEDMFDGQMSAQGRAYVQSIYRSRT
ncbi:AAA family ATPase [Catellatospora sichuanensis]|uniref:AAA family ATPase n=1 Tax=Catellatospora sichuanensis TaxID=1969805 RepID=UPI0011843232|nr:AAA family ATPase [Catellatospora sichuanensis]